MKAKLADFVVPVIVAFIGLVWGCGGNSETAIGTDGYVASDGDGEDRDEGFACTDNAVDCDGTWKTLCQGGSWVRITDCLDLDKVCREGACVRPLPDGDEGEVDSEPADAIDGDTELDQETDLAEQETVVDCTDGPCCNNGHWVAVGDPCVLGQDAFACTSDTCDAAHLCATHTLLADKCLVNDVCYDKHEAKPNFPCMWCQPSVSQTAFSDKPNTEACNDGDLCTFGETCDGKGACQAGSPLTCTSATDACGPRGSCNGTDTCEISYPDVEVACETDNETCTDDRCDGGGACAHVRQSDTCIIEGVCYPQHFDNPVNDCQWCDSTTNTWASKPSAESCASDDRACTMDHCSGGGVCLHEQSPGSCLIDGICYEDGADHPTNECQHCDSVFDSNGWRNKTNGLSCSTSDQCFSGACVDCANDSGCSDLVDDGLECSAPACDTNTHTCVHDLAARLGQACGDSSITACNIADTCDASGVCQPNYEPDGTNCDDGNICNGISTCASGQCGQTTAPVVCTTAHPACDPSTGLCVCAAGYHDESGLCVTDGYTRIFSGIYSMGSPADELGREPENETKHQVTLTYGFEMRTTEVTQEEFGARMNYSPSYFGSCGTNCPVEQVSWHEACAYANALSVQKGYSQCFDCVGTGPNFSCTLKGVYARPQDCPGFRLPTEAEWEYAARAGSATAFYPSTGNDGTISDPSGQDANLDRIGWYSGNSSDATHPVGDKAANAWGLYDVSGNVYEWVWDIWNGVDYGSGSVVDPTGPTVATGNRGFRGAGYDMAPQFARSAKRDGYYIEYRARDVGFRPVRTLERNGQAFRQGDTCANPFIVDSNPYRLENVDISLFQPDLQTGEKPCTGYANAGRDVVFFVPLEAGQTVSAVVTADYDAALYIVQDCIDMVCLAGSDDNLAGESETVTYTATAKTTVYIVVDHYSSDGPESGLFTITISR